MGQPAIDIKSEIGPLKRVLLHRPGGELENLMPEYLERLLFDDIPYLNIAQEEHDAFCGLLRDNGVEVVYLTDLVSESLTDGAVKEQFVRAYIAEAGVRGTKRTAMIADHFLSMSTHNMGCARPRCGATGGKTSPTTWKTTIPLSWTPSPTCILPGTPSPPWATG